MLALILLGVCIFTFIESTYYHQHSLALGDKASSVTTWVWVYRSIAIVAGIGCILIVGSVIKK